MAKKPGGDCQGVGGGVESPMVTNTPGVEELPQREETYIVTFEGDGVPEMDGQGRTGDGNSPAT